MGGTSFDVAVVIDGKPSDRREHAPRFPHPAAAADDRRAHDRRRRRLASRTSTAAASCRSGRDSAGADPGPGVPAAAAAREPTVTDANVVLGAHRSATARSAIERDEPRRRGRTARDRRRSAQKLGLGRRGDRRGDPRGRQPAHGRPHPAAVDRARPRSARLRARRLRRRRPAARRRADARGRHRRDAGAAVPRRAVRHGLRHRATCATTSRARSSAASSEIEPRRRSRRSCASSAPKAKPRSARAKRRSKC